MNIWKSYIWNAEWRIKWRMIIVVIYATFAVAKRRPEKKISGLYERDHWYTCAIRLAMPCKVEQTYLSERHHKTVKSFLTCFWSSFIQFILFLFWRSCIFHSLGSEWCSIFLVSEPVRLLKTANIIECVYAIVTWRIICWEFLVGQKRILVQFNVSH